MWHPSHFCGLPALVWPLSLRPASRPSTIFLHTATSGPYSSFTVFPLATTCGSIRPSRFFQCMSTYGSIHPSIVFFTSPRPAAPSAFYRFDNARLFAVFSQSLAHGYVWQLSPSAVFKLAVSRPRPSCPVTRSSPGGPWVVRCAAGL